MLGRYRRHKLVAPEVGKLDAPLGQFVATLEALRIEADYTPDVVQLKYGGELAAYRLRADQVLDQADTEFKRMLKLARRRT